MVNLPLSAGLRSHAGLTVLGGAWVNTPEFYGVVVAAAPQCATECASKTAAQLPANPGIN